MYFVPGGPRDDLAVQGDGDAGGRKTASCDDVGKGRGRIDLDYIAVDGDAYGHGGD
jgi:hypothetical protein